jgi:CelD/BcsL family acetyltransferase involved in cellulose biosynthesis
MVVAEIHRGRSVFPEFKADWDRLMTCGEHEPSVSFEWTAALLESHVRESDELVLIVLKRAGAVVGIVPLVLRPLEKFGRTLITAFPVSELSNTHSDLLIEDESEPVLAAFVDVLDRRELRWDVFGMTRFLETRSLGAQWCEILRRRWKLFEYTREQPSFFLTLDGSFGGYLQQRSGSFRNALKRIERKLMGRGTVEIRSQDDFSDFERAYEAMLSIEQCSWKQDWGTSIVAVSRQTTFYRSLCRQAFQNNRLHLGFLCLDGRPVAYNLGLIENGTYYYLKTSYDQAERPYSPATFLRAKLVEELIGRGVKYVDFPAEPYEWERQWTDEVRWHRSVTLFAPSAVGIAYCAYRKVKSLCRGSASQSIQYVNPRDLKPGLA